MPNRFQNEAEINGNAHSTSMQPIVPNKGASKYESTLLWKRVETLFWAQNTMVLVENKVCEARYWSENCMRKC